MDTMPPPHAVGAARAVARDVVVGVGVAGVSKAAALLAANTTGTTALGVGKCLQPLGACSVLLELTLPLITAEMRP